MTGQQPTHTPATPAESDHTGHPANGTHSGTQPPTPHPNHNDRANVRRRGLARGKPNGDTAGLAELIAGALARDYTSAELAAAILADGWRKPALPATQPTPAAIDRHRGKCCYGAPVLWAESATPSIVAGYPKPITAVDIEPADDGTVLLTIRHGRLTAHDVARCDRELFDGIPLYRPHFPTLAHRDHPLDGHCRRLESRS